MLISLHLAETLQHIICFSWSSKGRKSNAVHDHVSQSSVFFLYVNGASSKLKIEMSSESALSSVRLLNNSLKDVEVIDNFQ
jgi:hypothetical protein